MKAAGYVTGVYSSASSGIKMIDDARVNRPDAFVLPDRIWMARWDGVANTSTSYVREDGWRPRARVKQYRGGHDETWGGVRINIDTNYLDLGAGSIAAPETHCDGVVVSFPDYVPLAPATNSYTPARAAGEGAAVPAHREGPATRARSPASTTPRRSQAVNAWQTKRGYTADARWFKRDWMSLLAYGPPSGAEGRLRRRLRAPRPARPQRRRPQRPGQGRRRLRHRHRRRRPRPTRPRSSCRVTGVVDEHRTLAGLR